MFKCYVSGSDIVPHTFKRTRLYGALDNLIRNNFTILLTNFNESDNLIINYLIDKKYKNVDLISLYGQPIFKFLDSWNIVNIDKRYIIKYLINNSELCVFLFNKEDINSFEVPYEFIINGIELYLILVNKNYEQTINNYIEFNNFINNLAIDKKLKLEFTYNPVNIIGYDPYIFRENKDKEDR